MKITEKIGMFLSAIFLSGYLVAAEIAAFDKSNLKDNFFTITETDFSDVISKPELKIERQKKDIGDFSKIPNYSFSYLNQLIVDASNASVNTIDCVIYSINMKDIPDALIAARDRGVKIRIIMDESHVYPKADTQIKRLINAGDGIEVRTLRGTRSYGVNHNKITIHDRALVTTGSYNWTFGATFSNYENTLVFRNPVYVKGYVDYFEWMWSKARTIEQGASPEVPEGYYGIPPQDKSGSIVLNGIKVPLYLFSPGSDTENRIASLIDAARVSVDAVTFTFSSKPIADAIIRANARGVKVRFLEDDDMAKSSYMAKFIYEAGVPFRWIGGRNDKGAMHNKFFIFDGKILGTGSFNFTTNASVNSFENIVFTDDSSVVTAYQKQFDWFYSKATSPASSADFNKINSDITADGK